MPEVTAAAELGNRAFPVYPMGRLFQHLYDFAGRPGLLGFFDADSDLFPGDGIGDKDGAAFDMGDALSFGGIVRDNSFVNLIFDQHSLVSIMILRGVRPACS